MCACVYIYIYIYIHILCQDLPWAAFPGFPLSPLWRCYWSETLVGSAPRRLRSPKAKRGVVIIIIMIIMIMIIVIIQNNNNSIKSRNPT